METRAETRHPFVAAIVTGHFCEGPGYASWRESGTNDYLLMLTLSGAGRVGFGNGEIAARPGDLVLLCPHTPHDYGAAPEADGWEILWTHFLPHPHWLSYLRSWPEIAPGLMRLTLGETTGDVFREVAAALGEMHRRALSGLPNRDDFARCALEEALLWAGTVVDTSPAAARRDPRIERAAALLRERMSEQDAFATIADAVGLSVSRLAHLFRAQIGQSPQQFVESARMARARQLLTLTNRTVAAIAEELGYENPFYFTLRFKKHTGLSPRDWRRGVSGS